MEKFCFSCGAPLSNADFKGPAEDYCVHCTDKSGNLKSREEIKNGMAYWFKMWQPGLSQEKALVRAEHYLLAMPAWAD